MTKEDFIKLSQEKQEEFLLEGGVVSNDLKQEKVEAIPSSSEVLYSVSASTSPVSSKLKGGDNIQLPAIDPKVGQSSPEIEQTSKVGASSFDGYLIADPVELLFLLDDEVSKERVHLHPWQIQIALDFARDVYNDINPFQAVVRACNGSGKDKYVLAPCIVWLCMRYKCAIGVVTSSSGVQLDNQTCRYIKLLAEAANTKYKTMFGFEPWTCKYRHYECRFPDEIGGLEDESKSEVFCYATDEAGKAEGYHPTKYGAKMAILVSEDKTVADDINVALNKCTGYTHRLHVSTPGLPLGHFFDYCQLAINRNDVKSFSELSPTDWIHYHITAFDCPHLSSNYIEQMKRDLPGGENGSAFKSQVKAEFGTTDEMVVIPYTYIWRAVNKPPSHNFQAHNQAGLDLSDGGAETVLVIRNGNKVLKIIPFKFDDASDTEDFLVERFKEWNLDNPESFINGDCTGIGSPILAHLKRRGWRNIRFIDSRAAARRPKVYLNRATELFFNLRTLLERNEIILPRDDIMMRQLATRYYKINNKNVHQLLSKIEQRSRGYPSPDRADAINLAFWNYDSSYIEEESAKPFEIEEKEPTITGSFDQRAWANNQEMKWKANDGIPKKNFSYLEEEVKAYNERLQLK